MWWRLCKDSDVDARRTFPDRWQELKTYILANSPVSDVKKQEQMPWFDKMGERREMWAACYCWSVKTYRIHSMQRAEAIFSSVALFCKKKHHL
jgi:hypothetical protein